VLRRFVARELRAVLWVRVQIRTAERLTVLSGELLVRGQGDAEYVRYPSGTCFEVAAESSFDIKAEVPSAYLCELLYAAGPGPS